MAARGPPLSTKVDGRLRDGDVGAEVNVLNGVEKLHTFAHGALERFAAGDEAGAAGAFIDDGGGDGFFEVVGTGGAAAIDQPGASHVAVGNLVATEIDGMIAGKFGIDALVEFSVAGVAHVEGGVTAVIFGQLLLDNVG